MPRAPCLRRDAVGAGGRSGLAGSTSGTPRAQAPAHCAWTWLSIPKRPARADPAEAPPSTCSPPLPSCRRHPYAAGRSLVHARCSPPRVPPQKTWLPLGQQQSGGEWRPEHLQVHWAPGGPTKPSQPQELAAPQLPPHLETYPVAGRGIPVTSSFSYEEACWSSAPASRIRGQVTLMLKTGLALAGAAASLPLGVRWTTARGLASAAWLSSARSPLLLRSDGRPSLPRCLRSGSSLGRCQISETKASGGSSRQCGNTRGGADSEDR